MGHPGGDKPCGHLVPFHDRGLRGLVLKSSLRELDRIPIPQDTTGETPARACPRAPSDPTPGQHFQLGFSSSEEGRLALLRAKGSEVRGPLAPGLRLSAASLAFPGLGVAGSMRL